MEQYSRKKQRITNDKVSANNPRAANEEANPITSERFPEYNRTYSRTHRGPRKNNSSSSCDKGIFVSSNKYPEVAKQHSGLSRLSERLDPLETDLKKGIKKDFRLSRSTRTETNDNRESSHHSTNNGGSLDWDPKNVSSAKQSTMINANEKANPIASKRFPEFDHIYSRSYRGVRKNNSSSVFDKDIPVSSNKYPEVHRQHSGLGRPIERPDPLDIELKKRIKKDFLLSRSTTTRTHDHTESSHHSTYNWGSLVSDSRNASSVKQSVVINNSVATYGKDKHANSRRPGDFKYTYIKKRNRDSTARDKRCEPKVVHTYRRRHSGNKHKEDNGFLGTGIENESSRSGKNISKDQLLPMSASRSSNCREDQAHGNSIDLRDMLAPQSTSTEGLGLMTLKDDFDCMADANTGKSLCFSYHIENNQTDGLHSDCSTEEIGRSACTSHPSTQTQQKCSNQGESLKFDVQDNQNESSGCHKEEKNSSAEREGREAENVGPVTIPRLTICTKKILLVLDLNGLLVDVTCISQNDRHIKAHKRVGGKSVFKRPFCDKFLDFCFSAFDVGVWSSRRKVNVDSVINYIMGGRKRNLLFCWDQSRCTITGFKTIENMHKPLVLKELKKLWDKEEPGLPWEDGKYSESNTLLIDDSPYKALCNPPHTAIFPCPYSFRDENDCSLGPGGDIRVYLERLAMASDVQLYVQEHPFGQQAITSSSRSWKFYSKIIQKFTKAAPANS